MKADIGKQFAACDGVLSVENFERTNGRDAQGGRYIAEVQYDVVLVSDVNIPARVVPNDLPAAPSCAWNAFFTLYQGRPGTYRSGTKIHVGPIELGYVKTENGWVPG
jgi:hypothetical protein